jgi:hypothetical protein
MPDLRAGHVSVRAAALAAVLLLAPGAGWAEIVWLRNGDRLTGTIVSETKTSLRLKLPFATLLIPKSRIDRLTRADGKEEVLATSPLVAATSPSPAPPPSPPKPNLVLAVTGASFWQAWDRKDAPADPTLRLQVRIDEQPVATWVDATLDPEDLPGAIVNTFAFTSGDEAGVAAPGVLLMPPEVQPGRVVLRIGDPAAIGADRHVRISYQVNEGTDAAPAWRELAAAGTTVTVRSDGPTLLQLRQERGRMEFARKRMRDVDSFRIDIVPE